MLCTSLLLFNFQRSSPPLSRRPFYYTTSLPVCQYLFENFLKFFQDFFEASLIRFSVAPPSRTACILYYFCFHLSSLFFTFFCFFLAFVTSSSLYMSFCTTFWAKSIQYYQNIRHILQTKAFHFVQDKQKR